jgi:hypothetical protein
MDSPGACQSIGATTLSFLTLFPPTPSAHVSGPLVQGLGRFAAMCCAVDQEKLEQASCRRMICLFVRFSLLLFYCPLRWKRAGFSSRHRPKAHPKPLASTLSCVQMWRRDALVFPLRRHFGITLVGDSDAKRKEETMGIGPSLRTTARCRG